MKMLHTISLLAFVCLLATCKAAERSPTLIAANNPHFTYEGRIDFSNTASPHIIWQGTTIAIHFQGPNLDLNFSSLQGQVYFDLTIDEQTTILKAQNGQISSTLSLSKGRHTLTLTKRSEASAGTVHFDGITAQATFEFRSNPEQAQSVEGQPTYLFYGDSITAGACNEDGDSDQWNDRSTHNANLSYGALAAKAMHATYRNIAISGMGISMGYTPHTFPEIWNRYEPNPDSPIANVSSYQPDTIFINLGENDNSFSSNQGQGFPSNYSSRYIAMVREMRNTYPDSRFVILRGGMYGGSQSQRLRGPWQEVVGILESEDPNLTHYIFNHWSSQHPRVADHQKMANELASWLKDNQQ